VLRRFFRVGTALAAVVVALVAAVHLAPVRARLVAVAVEWLREHAGIEAVAGSVSYNLFTLRLHTQRLTLAARGHGHEPFLIADEAAATLGWSTLRGQPVFDAVEIAGARLAIVRRADGSSNLPQASGEGGRGPDRIEIGRVALRDASLAFVDEAADAAVEAGGLSLELVPRGSGTSAGELSVRRGPSIRIGTRTTTASRLDGRLAFDGRTVSIERLVLEAPEGRMQLDGRLVSLLSDPRAEIEAVGTLTLSRLSSWAALDPAVRGTVALRADVDGPLADPSVGVSLESDAVSWRHLGAVSLQARATVRSTGVNLESATLGIDAGEVSARGRAALDGETGDVHVEWRRVGAAALLGPAAPFPIAAHLHGTLDATWTGKDARRVRATAEHRAEPAAGGTKTVPVGGHASLVAADGQWRLQHDHQIADAARVNGDAAGRVPVGDTPASPLAGIVHVVVPNVGRALPPLRAAGVDVADWMNDATGALRAELRLGGSTPEPQLSGSAVLDGLTVAGVGPMDVTTGLRLDAHQGSFPDLQASMGANRAAASASIDWETDRIAAAATVDLADLSALATPLSEWRPAGAMTGRVEVAGTLTRPSVQADLDGASLAVAGQDVGALSTRIEYAGGTIAARTIELRQPAGGRLSADGEYSTATGAFAVKASARGVTIVPVRRGDDTWPIAAMFDADFAGEGTLEDVGGAGRVGFSRTSWGDVALGSPEADITITDSVAHIEARAPRFALQAGGAVHLRSPWQYTLTATIEDAELDDIANDIAAAGGTIPPVFERLEGRADADVRAAGTLDDVAASDVALTVTQLDVRSDRATVELIKPWTLRYDQSRIAIDPLELRTGSTVLTAAGELARTSAERGIEASLVGSLGDLQPWLELWGPLPIGSASGTISARIAATGSRERPVLAGSLALSDAAVEFRPKPDSAGQASAIPPVTSISISATLADGTIEMPQIGAAWQEATLSGRGRLPLRLLSAQLPEAVLRALPARADEATLVATIDGATQAVITPFLTTAPDQPLDGRAQASIDLRAAALDADSVRGTLTLNQFELRASGVGLKQSQPARLELADGILHLRSWSVEAEGNRLDIAGQTELTGSRALDMTIGGRLDFRAARAFLPGMTTGGIGDVLLRVHGPAAAPVADGSILVRDGLIRIADPQVAVTSLSGRVLFDGGRVELSGFEAFVNGGRARIVGGLQLSGLTPTDGTLAIVGEEIGLNVPRGLRTGVDADLRLTFAAGFPRLVGRVSIRRGAYREPMSLAAGLVGAARQRGGAGVPAAAGPSWLDGLALQVAIVSTNEIVVANNYGRMALDVDIRLVGTVGQPSIVGRTTVREGGLLYLGSRVYQIEHGIIDFTSPEVVVPRLDVRARTRVSGYDITLAISGTPETLEGNVSSDPPLGQRDIVSLLATGRMADDLSGAQGTVAREQVLGLLTGEVLGFAARAIGVDTLRFERGSGLEGPRGHASLIAGETDPSSRLTLSKYFSRSVEVVVSRDLSDGGNLTWIVSYLPKRNVELRAVSLDDTSRSYEVRHDVSFGAHTAQVMPRAPAAAASADRVTAVTFSGVPLFPQQDLQQQLKLRAGSRFDFAIWQDDVERLRQFYVVRDHPEAQVRERRVNTDSDGRPAVALEYEIDPGPRAALVVEGYAPPRDLLRRLQQTWSDAVFDEARLADLRNQVLAHLIDAGYLQADVTAAFEPPQPPEEKRVRIVAVPGEHTVSREIRFEGNSRVSGNRLESLVGDPQVVREAWLDPASLARHVAELYRAEGLLAARVDAGPAEFTDGAARAVLAVRIVEGNPFTIARLGISGVAARNEADVLAAFGVQTGAEYVPAAIESARRAVEADYRRQGFNSARAVVLTAVNPALASVDLTLQVEEGVRQVLEAINIRGTEGLRPRAISEALRLETGQPVDMVALEDARRRLLDTGLFRTVDIEPVPAGGAAPDSPAAAERMTAQVTAQRWPTWRLRYGGEITDQPAADSDTRDFGLGVTADVQRRVLFGRAATLGASARVSRDDRIFRGYFTVPSFFTLPVTSTLFLERSRESLFVENEVAFVTNLTTFTAEQRFQVGRRLQVSYGYQFERNRTFDPTPDPADPIVFDVTVTQARLISSGVFDARDDAFDTIRGWLHSSSVEYAADALGSDIRFTKYYAQQFYFFPLRKLVIASAARLGIAFGVDDELIRSERFFAGGGNTVRGYPPNSLGPTDLFGPRGGQALLILNEELRFPLYRWVRGVGFLDAGNVFPRPGDVSVTDLSISVGGGFRVATPVGLIRIDLGVPLSREDGRRSPRLHFSLGQMF
jgi:outer membrane protein assembly complex protein YaeT